MGSNLDSIKVGDGVDIVTEGQLVRAFVIEIKKTWFGTKYRCECKRRTSENDSTIQLSVVKWISSKDIYQII